MTFLGCVRSCFQACLNFLGAWITGMACFRFRNQICSINKNYILLFGSLQHFQLSLTRQCSPTLCLSVRTSLLNWMPNMSSLGIWLVSRRHDTDFLCNPVELPVCQQRKAWFSKKKGSLLGLIVQQMPAPQCEPWAHTVTARQSRKILSTGLRFNMVVSGGNWMLGLSADLLSRVHHKW